MLVPETEIIIKKDGAEIARHFIQPGDYVIGRDAECDLHLDVDLVSRRHAQLTVNYDHALIEDLGSSNGTFVNGKPITEATRLWPNQKIQVGAATIELHRVKAASSSDHSLTPQTAAVRKILPEEFLRERKYDIGGVVAQGGMGAILNAREATIERTVAMKVMLDSSSPADLGRFIAEAKVTGQLEHPNIVPIYELSVDENDQVFYTMKMVRGITLRKVLELMAGGAAATVKKYPLGALLTIFQKVCDALAFAHSKGVIHRDLKPENIMLGDFGEVLLMDWGLAKVLDAQHTVPTAFASSAIRSLVHSAVRDDLSASATMAGAIMGTPQYMAPEQARGEVELLDARSDIYALGAILYYLLVLRPPISGTDAMEIVGRVAAGRTDPLDVTKKHAHLPGGRVPDSLAAVVGKAMALQPAARYQSVADLQADLAAYQDGFATSAEKAGAWKQCTLFIKRHKVAAASAALIVSLTAGFLVKVLASERRALETIGRLRGTAPTFYEQAQALIEKQQFSGALEKIVYAIELAPDNASYQFLKGNIFESLGRLTEAQAAYDLVLRRDSTHAFARENRDLCAQLLREQDGHTELSKASLNKLNLLMRKQGRTAEAIATLRETSKDRKALMDTWRAVLAKAGINDLTSSYLALGDDGLFELRLGARKAGGKLLDDISFLRGMPLKMLGIDATNVSDLTPLAGAPLEVLDMRNTPVSDLGPLRTMKLRELEIPGTKVTDLTPLKAMPLKRLNIVDNGITDLGPLAGMPLAALFMSNTKVADLSPLRGMPLAELEIGATPVKDLSVLKGMKLKRLVLMSVRTPTLEPLRGMPLVELNLGRVNVNDLSPLAGMPLEKLMLIDNSVSDLRPLQGLPLIHLNGASTSGTGRALADLTALKGMKLLSFSFTGSHVQDLSPLRGQPIEAADFASTPVTDFSVLATWPLKRLNASHTALADLEVLAGKRLEVLFIADTAVADIAVLRTMPLTVLRLNGTKITDLRPLADIPTLNELTIPEGARDIEFLRHLPNIQHLDYKTSYGGGTPIPAAEFWKAYDAKKKSGTP